MYDVCAVDMGRGVPPQPESAEEEQGQVSRQAQTDQEGQHQQKAHVCMRDSKELYRGMNALIKRNTSFFNY